MTTDRPDPTPTLQDEFWGAQADWTSDPGRDPFRPTRPRRGGLGRWWASVLGTDIDAERIHGRTAPTIADGPFDADDLGTDDSVPSEHDVSGGDWPDAEAGDLDADHPDDDWDDGWEVEAEPRRSLPIDPLIARLGAVVVIATLAVPVLLGFASDSTAGSILDELAAAPSQVADSPSAASGASTGDAVATQNPETPVADTPSSPAGASDPTPADAAPAPDGASDDAASPALRVAELDSADESAPCGSEYELAAGDYWIRIADAADVPLRDLLDVNAASIDTVLVPGQSICLPVGATTPAPPPTAAPVTTSAPASQAVTSARPAAPATTAAPATAPTTTAPARPAAVSADQAVAIIRSIWPDELEERAIEIAWRESNHRSNVNNWCCYGLFQIHWEAHRSWLGSLGVTSVTQLYDPTVNAQAAYALYQRAGGFGPWGG